MWGNPAAKEVLIDCDSTLMRSVKETTILKLNRYCILPKDTTSLVWDKSIPCRGPSDASRMKSIMQLLNLGKQFL